ncbi:MAG: hypothetical protein H7A04_16050 [Pseudomonadales bacterium]|nr:hypothetical protein [Pseudomonadales bacterium]
MAANTLQQISVLLDTRIPLEAMVLQRLHRLPKDRQNEWLRQLVLTAFRGECQILKSEPLSSTRASITRPPDLRGPMQGKHAPDQVSPKPSMTIASHANDSHSGTQDKVSARPAPIAQAAKPFTHLKRVIGV